MRPIFAAAAVALFVCYAQAAPKVVTAPASSSQVANAPAGQVSIVSVLRTYASAYKDAPHDLRRAAVRNERAAALCAQLRQIAEADRSHYEVRNWRGRLRSIVAQLFTSGTYLVVIDVGQPVTLYGFLDEKSPILKRLVNVSTPVDVVIDGTLKANEKDCVDDATFTEAAMMKQPELLFNVHRLDLAQ